MAKGTLARNIERAIADFKNIKKSIESLGWNLEGIPTSWYPGTLELIPSTVLHEGMTEIPDYAFNAIIMSGGTSIPYHSLYSHLAFISIPSTITNIGAYAFGGCSKLTLTSLPDGVTTIGERAFTSCSNLALTSLPENLTSIGDNAFSGCTNITLTSLPKSLTYIDGQAFKGCTNITTLTFNSRPEVFGTLCLGGMDNLTDVFVPWSEGGVAGAPWGAENATIHYNCITSLPEGTTDIVDGAYTNNESVLLTSLPSTVTGIGNNAFEGCTNMALTSLPDGLTIIGQYAFANCTKLDIDIIPESVYEIGSGAFMGCTGLTEITFEGTPAVLSFDTFEGCTNLVRINVPWLLGEVPEAPWGAPWSGSNMSICYGDGTVVFPSVSM